MIYQIRYEGVEQSRPNITGFVFPGSGTAVVDAPLTENGGAIGYDESHQATARLHSSECGDEVRAMAYHILIVEDERDTRELLDFTLRWNGHHVDTATNGREALDLLGEHSYDVILSNLNMPGMDGGNVSGCVNEEKAV
jgi:hypothetical protein